MKTKELIKQLQEADPSGEIEVNAPGGDILFVEKLAGFWDGDYFILNRDENNQVHDLKITDKGEKIIIHTYSLDDILWDFPDFPITVDVRDSMKERYEKMISDVRKEVKDFEKQNGFK